MVLFSILLTLLAPPAAAGLSADGPPVAPVLRFSGNEVAYGDLLQGEVTEKELKIFNDGDAPLVITTATPSCGCTTVVSFDREIAPGTAGTVRFQIDSKKIKPGESNKRIQFATNDPKQPLAGYYFSAEVISLYRTDPREIRVSGLFDSEKSATIRLVGITEYGFTLMGIRSRGQMFEVEDFEEIDERTYQVKIVVGPASAPGKTRDPLDLLIEVKDGRQIQVGQWVNIEHLDPVLVAPDRALQFNNADTDRLLVAGAPPVVKTVTLRSRDAERPLQVLSARLEDLPEGAFSVEVHPIVVGSHYTVQVSLPAYRAEAFLMGKLVIETDAAVEPIRTLDLRAKFGRKTGE